MRGHEHLSTAAIIDLLPFKEQDLGDILIERWAGLHSENQTQRKTIAQLQDGAVIDKGTIAQQTERIKELEARGTAFEKELRETWDYEDSHIEALLPQNEVTSDDN